MSKKNVTLLIVDNNDVGAREAYRALQKQKIANLIINAHNINEALDILHGKHPSLKVNPPYLVLLDLQLAKEDGCEFLEKLRENNKTKETVVFIMTASSCEGNISKAYDKDIAGYLTKSSLGESLIEALALLDSYWRIIEFPSND